MKLTASPATGSSFARWFGACTGSSSGCEIEMEADRGVAATFAEAPSPPPASEACPLTATVSTDRR